MDKRICTLLESYYVSHRYVYDSLIESLVNEQLEKNINNIFELVDLRFAEDMCKKLDKKIIEKYVDLTCESNDATKIYKCAYNIAKDNPEYVDRLIKAMFKTENLEKVYALAVLVQGINKEQFFTLLKKMVDEKEAEGIVLLSTYSTGEGCPYYKNSFNVLNQYVEYILGKHDAKLIRDILNIVHEKQERSKTKPSYAIPYGQASNTEMDKFERLLSKKSKRLLRKETPAEDDNEDEIG